MNNINKMPDRLYTAAEDAAAAAAHTKMRRSDTWRIDMNYFRVRQLRGAVLVYWFGDRPLSLDRPICVGAQSTSGGGRGKTFCLN